VHTEDDLLVDLTGIGTETPHLLRIARLYCCARGSASVWFAATVPSRDDVLERGGTHAELHAASLDLAAKPLLFTVLFVAFSLPDARFNAAGTARAPARLAHARYAHCSCRASVRQQPTLRALARLVPQIDSRRTRRHADALGNVVRRPLVPHHFAQQQQRGMAPHSSLAT